jgi:DNA-binding response OmpR family regulator
MPEAAHTPVAGSAPPKRLLLVEDDDLALDLMATTLHRAGYHVDTATRGAEAIEKFHAANYDLVITDNRLPDMTGEVVHAAISATHPGIPAILITGLVSDVSRRDRFAAILAKPFRFPELEAVVESVLSAR